MSSWGKRVGRPSGFGQSWDQAASRNLTSKPPSIATSVIPWSDSVITPSRRDFFKLLTTYLVGASGLVGLAGIARYLSFDTGATRTTMYDLGPASTFAVGSRTRIAEIPALIVRDEVGFTALSLECTHLGCTVEDAPEGFQCPCHGSRYDGNGNVTRGPAARSLTRLRVEVTADDRLVVHTD